MDMDKIIRRIHQLPAREQREMLDLISAIEKQKQVEGARTAFMPFMRALWPDFISGNHHKRIAECFDRIISGDLKRLIICLPPRHSKSEMTSCFLPAFYLGKNPRGKIIQAMHTADLSVSFGRKTRNLMDTNEYKEIFPDVTIAADAKAAGRWGTNKGGEYYAVGVGGALAGRGADLMIIDDPVSEQDANMALANPEIYENIYEWYQTGPRQRLQPGGAICIVMCVEGSQRVLLGDGSWKPISEVTTDDVVVSWKNGQIAKNRVLATKNQGPDDLLEVISRSASVKVNGRHPFLVVRGGSDKSPQTQSDVIKSREWEYEWVQAQDLKKGDVVVHIKNMGTAGHRPMRFGRKRQMTQDDYWFLGFMFGDGWLINSGDRGCVGYCWAHSKYEVRNNRAIDYCENVLGSNLVKTEFGYYRADHKDAGIWLKSIGFDSGAKTKRLPKWVYKLRPCDKRTFLMGFFAADGWCRPAKRAVDTYSVCLANRELLDDLRLLARTCGYRTTKITEYKYTAQAPNSPNPTEACNYIAKFTDTSAKSDLKSRFRYQGNSPLFRFETINDVIPAGRGDVYDITVESDENFIAEGFVVHNTRWSQNDLVGKVLKKAQNPDSIDKWEVIEFPAILPSGRPLWPEFWSLESLQATKAALSVPQWNAQYMQSPTSEEGALIKRDWWQLWPEHKKYPKFEAIIQSWDTAFLKTERSNYSACTTWGLFYPDPDSKVPNVLLIDAMKAKLEFPQLKKKAMDLYNEWQPDSVVVEAKAAGAPLIYELRAMGIPIKEFTPSRGQDKIVRVNSITDIFASGMVWRPDSRWSEEVADECAAFPNGESDDIVDTCLAADTKIYTARGLKLIEDIAVGDLVMTHLGRFRKVTATGSRVSDHINKLKAATLDEISITGNHPVLAADIRYDAKGVRTVSMVNWNRADELLVRPQYQFRRGDRLVTSARAAPHHAVILPASSEVMQDIDLTSYTDCNYDDVYVYGRTTKINRKVKLNYDFGFLCGLFIAEGCVVYKREIAHGISISCDKGILEKLQGSFLELLGIKTVLKLGSGCHVLTGLSKPLGQFFETFGRLAENKIVPEWCFSGGSDFICGFLDGYGHGDGSYFKNQLKITSTSLSAMWGARLLAARAGFNGKINLSKPAGKRNVFGHHCQCLDAYSLNFITTKGNNGIGADTVYGPAFYVTKNERIDEPTVVYNISVEEDESYVTTGGVVHNCSQALLLMRQGGWIGSSNDNWDDDSGGEWWKHRKADYY